MTRWGSVSQAARERGISERTVRRFIAQGDVYAERIGPRLIRVDLDSFKTAPIAAIA